MFLRRLICSTILLLVLPAVAAPEKPNVLFIAVDDLRPELGSYGSDLVTTPNFDRLASRSLQFERAYCQYPLCSPSRISVLTGIRPDTFGIYDLKTSFREKSSHTVTLPQLFKENGYHTQSIGKIFHATSGPLSDPQSWSVSPAEGRDRAPTPDGKPRRWHGLPYESPDVADNMLPDGDAADMAIDALRKNAGRPFFLALGFTKPHLPFIAPKRYWDKVQETSVPLPSNPNPPAGAPPYSTNNSGELRQWEGIPKQGPLSREEAQRHKEGYIACVNYVDTQLGRVLDELDRLGLREKTIVILWSDHGYSLGEHGTWTKHTVWEDSARVPILLADPAGTSAGKKTKALVELVDIYPTIADMCGIPVPQKMEGISLVPLLKKPEVSWKTGAFTSFRKHHPGVGGIEARSIRTDRYRFIDWSALDTKHADFGAIELYDHQNDPAENTNIAGRPENVQLVKELQEQLSAGWEAAKPPRQ